MSQEGYMVYNTFHQRMMSIHFDEMEADKAAEDAQQFFGDKMVVIPVLVTATTEIQARQDG